MKNRLFIVLIAAMIFGFLISSPAVAGNIISDIFTDRSSYQPGSAVTIFVELTNRSGQALNHSQVVARCWYLDDESYSLPTQHVSLKADESATLTFTWAAPDIDYRGYGVSVAVVDGDHLYDTAGTAIDVSSTWTKFPRYGYVCSFPAQPTKTSNEEIGALCKFHLNLVQFQDWQYRHDTPVAGDVTHPAASWNDIANRPTYRQTILDMIDAAHRGGMSTMNYNLIYGGWEGYEDHGVSQKWALFTTSDGTRQDSLPMPSGWATPALYLFNPANLDWQNYLFTQEENVFAAYPFDGWQADEVGGRGIEHDVTGKVVDVWPTFRPFLNNARGRLKRPIIFNNVGGYGLYDTAANADVDAVYVECWPFVAGEADYNGLKSTIDQAVKWSKGKAVILAAYMDYNYSDRFSRDNPGSFNIPGVLLTDAAIFASGGSHLEIGEGSQMLDHEYFPNRNLEMSVALKTRLRGYYDFLVAYENLLHITDVDQTPISLDRPSSSDGKANTIWVFAKSSGGNHVLDLINLLGETSTSWRDDNGDHPAPETQRNVKVKYYSGTDADASVKWASPDSGSGKLNTLSIANGADSQGSYIEFTLPRLEYWDLVYLDNSPHSGSPPTSHVGLTHPPSVLPPPLSLTSDPGDDSATISWQSVRGATSYNVYRGLAPGAEGTTAIIRGLTQVSYTDGGLSTDTRYYYRISAVNASGEGALSEEISGESMRTGPPVGHYIAIIANNNDRYVNIDGAHDNDLVASASSPAVAEKFAVVSTGIPGVVALASQSTERYVSDNVNGGSVIMAKWAQSVGQWEQFSWKSVGNGNFALLSAVNGGYVSTGDGSVLVADGIDARSVSQTFRYIDLGPISALIEVPKAGSCDQYHYRWHALRARSR